MHKMFNIKINLGNKLYISFILKEYGDLIFILFFLQLLLCYITVLWMMQHLNKYKVTEL